MLNKELKQSILEKLLVQYKNYMEVFNEIKDLKFKLLKSEESEKENLKIKIDFLNKVLERLSDEMTFPTPSIWMMYKFYAYKNTDKEIVTVSDFFDHCSPEGYICTKRFQYLTKNFDFDRFAKSKNLNQVITSQELEALEQNKNFMNGWLEREFKISNNKILKWD